MAALNPITHADATTLAAVLALDPATRSEERLQSLLYLWLRKYFSGTAFATLTANGGTENEIFTQCGFGFQEESQKDPLTRPVIHLVMPDRKTQRADYGATREGHDDAWTIDALIKVPHSLTLTSMPGACAEDIAIRVGSELEWLLSSSEREALTEQGVRQTRLERPSTLLSAGEWKMRMLVFSCKTRREMARRSFA